MIVKYYWATAGGYYLNRQYAGMIAAAAGSKIEQCVPVSHAHRRRRRSGGRVRCRAKRDDSPHPSADRIPQFGQLKILFGSTIICLN